MAISLQNSNFYLVLIRSPGPTVKEYADWMVATSILAPPGRCSVVTRIVDSSPASGSRGVADTRPAVGVTVAGAGAASSILD